MDSNCQKHIGQSIFKLAALKCLCISPGTHLLVLPRLAQLSCLDFILSRLLNISWHLFESVFCSFNLQTLPPVFPTLTNMLFNFCVYRLMCPWIDTSHSHRGLVPWLIQNEVPLWFINSVFWLDVKTLVCRVILMRVCTTSVVLCEKFIQRRKQRL